MTTLESPLTGKPVTGLTPWLAEFIVNDSPPRSARQRAATSVLDTIAVLLAGGKEPDVRKLARTIIPVENDGSGVPDFWQHRRLRPNDAALLYGMASHVLDYDDVSMEAICHPTAPVLCACLAAVDDASTGAEVIEAVCVGTEVMIRIGQALGFRHYDLGFHATGTLGALGAASAVSRLRGLDVETTVAALSIAASSASGLRRNFGTPVKSLHVGLAAQAGLRSVDLAQAGLAGAGEPLEDGYFKAFSGDQTTRWPDDLTLGAPYIIDTPGFELKRYPCCYMLHRLIHATLDLYGRGIRLDDVASATVVLAPGGTSALIHPYPTTALQALFSGPYAVLAALTDGRINLASFTQEAVSRPAIQSRLRDVALIERAGNPGGAGDVGSAPVTVTLRLTDGSDVSATCTLSPGSPADPFTSGQIFDKWQDSVARYAPNCDPARSRALFDEIIDLDRMGPVIPWLERLACDLKDAR